MLDYKRQQGDRAWSWFLVDLPLLAAGLTVGSDPFCVNPKRVKAPGTLPGNLKFLGTNFIDQGLRHGELQSAIDDQQVRKLGGNNKDQ